MSISVGAEAPDFTLHATNDEEITLSDYRGEQNVLLLFFPLAFSPVCHDELCSLRDNHGEYEDLNARILGVSGDSVFTLKAWTEKEGFPFPLLSDFNHEVAPKYGSLFDELAWMQNVSKRSAFVIDKEGIVRYAEVGATPKDLPDFEAIQGVLAELG